MPCPTYCGKPAFVSSIATIYRHSALRVLGSKTGGEIFAIERDGTLVLRGRVIGRDKEVADVLTKSVSREGDKKETSK